MFSKPPKTLKITFVILIFFPLPQKDAGWQRAVLPGWGAGRSRLDAAQRLHRLCALQPAGLCPRALQHSRPESAGISQFFSLWIYGSGSSIFIESVSGYGTRIVMTKNLRKENSVNFFFSFLDPKLQFTYPEASIKDVQATGEALKREYPALQKMKFINCFLIFWALFALLEPGFVLEHFNTAVQNQQASLSFS